ncbi:MAG: energy transducer TonB [Terriglobales bacterium]
MGRRVAILFMAVLGVVMGAAAQNSAPPERERKVVRRVVPTYPDLARKLQISGVVKLNATVAPNGSVKSMKVVGGNPVLIQAAEEAVGNWKFAPAAEETHELIELRFGPR